MTAAVANFLFFTGLAGFVLLPLHLRRLGATDGQLGLIMACYSATAIVVQPVVGAWVDRGGRRAFLVTGAVLTSGVALLFAAAPDTLGLFPLLRALQGVAFSVFFIANFTVVVDLVPPDRRSQALGIFGISGLVSGAVGPALGELLVQAAGFRGLFLAAAALPLLAAVISARLRLPPEPRRSAPAEGLPGLLRGILLAPRLPMTLGAAFGLGQGVMFTFFPTYALDLGVRWVGLFAVTYSGAALGVRATASGLADTLGRRAVIIPALGLQAAATVLLAGLGPTRAEPEPPGRAVPGRRRPPRGRRARTPVPGAHRARRRRDAARAPRPHGRGVHGLHPPRPGRGRGGVRPPRPSGGLRRDVRHPERRARRRVRPRLPAGALTSGGGILPHGAARAPREEGGPCEERGRGR